MNLKPDTEAKVVAARKWPMRNYNIFALQGDDSTDDMDVVETMGLDPVVAYTPDINVKAIDKMRQENKENYLKQGLDEDAATKLADTQAQATKATINALMRDQQIDFQI
jgi:hypothetical protein